MVVLVTAQVRGHLGLQTGLQDQLGQLRKQARPHRLGKIPWPSARSASNRTGCSSPASSTEPAKHTLRRPAPQPSSHQSQVHPSPQELHQVLVWSHRGQGMVSGAYGHQPIAAFGRPVARSLTGHRSASATATKTSPPTPGPARLPRRLELQPPASRHAITTGRYFFASP